MEVRHAVGQLGQSDGGRTDPPMFDRRSMQHRQETQIPIEPRSPGNADNAKGGSRQLIARNASSYDVRDCSCLNAAKADAASRKAATPSRPVGTSEHRPETRLAKAAISAL